MRNRVNTILSFKRRERSFTIVKVSQASHNLSLSLPPSFSLDLFRFNIVSNGRYKYIYIHIGSWYINLTPSSAAVAATRAIDACT